MILDIEIRMSAVPNSGTIAGGKWGVRYILLSLQPPDV